MSNTPLPTYSHRKFLRIVSPQILDGHYDYLSRSRIIVRPEFPLQGAFFHFVEKCTSIADQPTSLCRHILSGCSSCRQECKEEYDQYG